MSKDALVVSEEVRSMARELGKTLAASQKGKRLTGSELRTAVRLSILEQSGLMQEIVVGAETA